MKWTDWIPYVATFICGGGLGALLTYVFAPRADRDRMEFEREKHEAEQKSHVRQRRIQDLEDLRVLLRSTLALKNLYLVKQESPPTAEEFRTLMDHFDALILATNAVIGEVPTDPKRAQELLAVPANMTSWLKEHVGVEGPEAYGDASKFDESIFRAMATARMLLDST